MAWILRIRNMRKDIICLGDLEMDMNMELEDSSQVEKRGTQRHNIYIPIRFEGEDINNNKVSEDTVIINTSPGGAFFLSRNEFQPGTELNIHVKPVAKGSGGRELVARVVRVDSDVKGFSERSKFGIAIALLEMVDLYKGYKKL